MAAIFLVDFFFFSPLLLALRFILEPPVPPFVLFVLDLDRVWVFLLQTIHCEPMMTGLTCLFLLPLRFGRAAPPALGVGDLEGPPMRPLADVDERVATSGFFLLRGVASPVTRGERADRGVFVPPTMLERVEPSGLFDESTPFVSYKQFHLMSILDSVHLLNRPTCSSLVGHRPSRSRLVLASRVVVDLPKCCRTVSIGITWPLSPAHCDDECLFFQIINQLQVDGVKICKGSSLLTSCVTGRKSKSCSCP